MSFHRTLRRGVLAIFVILSAALPLWAQTPLKSADFTPGSWSLVLLPDTQFYSDRFPGLFTLQTHWIVKNKDKYDIRYVLGLGDITDKNTERQWRHAKEAIAELDGRVPYALASGNHDYTPHGDSASGRSGMNKFFPPSSFQKWPTFGGVMKQDDITNSYHLFRAGKTDWIVMVLQWAPSDAAVKWANEVLAKYPKRKAILVTHAYLYDDNTRYDFAKKGKKQEWNPHSYIRSSCNDGEELWQKLVRKNNFALVFCGHVSIHGYSFLVSKNDRGNRVYQMLADYQSRQLGGEAYLRILEFLPDGKTVHVKSYSPLYDKYLNDAGNQFSFELDR
jgi:Calcineurin-like phosphoesterase